MGGWDFYSILLRNVILRKYHPTTLYYMDIYVGFHLIHAAGISIPWNGKMPNLDQQQKSLFPHLTYTEKTSCGQIKLGFSGTKNSPCIKVNINFTTNKKYPSMERKKIEGREGKILKDK